jgi:IS5 family transposase
LERNRLKGVAGDALNAILSAAAMNFHKLLRAFLRILLGSLLAIWNALLTLQDPQARNTRLQNA